MITARLGVGLALALAIISALALGSAAAQGASGRASATPVSLFNKSAQLLIPTLNTPTGAFTQQAGSAKRATATFTGSTGEGGRPLSGTLAVRVFPTEAAAKASYAASCLGCRGGTVVPQKWPYKFRYDNVGGVANGGVTLSGLCRNVAAEVVLTTPLGLSTLNAWGKKLLWPVFDKAVALGMTQCGAAPSPPPRTGSYFWTESEAEAMVIRKVLISQCNISNTAGCEYARRERVKSAECRGLDEKPGTFTYSRFTCEIVTGSRYYTGARGRIAVWPTGPTAMRWTVL
jgi:hypothetical protein